MAVSCGALWPSGSAGEALLHWGFIAGQLGADAGLARPFLIGIRGVAPDDQETHQAVHRPRYDDTFVLLTATALPLVFAGATHAYQFDSRDSPDVDGDGRGDVGSIRPGRYLLTDTRSAPHPIFHLTLPDGTTDRIPAYRDTNHDGVISQAELQASLNRRKGNQVNDDGDYAAAVLMHTGFDAPPNAQHRSSIACQTCSLQWLEKLRDAAKTGGGKIDYVLADAEDVLAIALKRNAAPSNVA